MNGLLQIMFVLAYTIPVDGKELYEFLAVTKVGGLPPAASFSRRAVLQLEGFREEAGSGRRAVRAPGGRPRFPAAPCRKSQRVPERFLDPFY